MPDERRAIEGKVAQILSSRELALNVGYEDGVELGMRFAIMDFGGPEIVDPETQEYLGTASVAKTIVKIVRITNDHLSIGRTFRTVGARKGIMSTIGGLDQTSIFGSPGYTESLPLDPETRAQLGNVKRPVKVGDTATQTIGDEYDEA